MRKVAIVTPATAPENFSFSWTMMRKDVLKSIRGPSGGRTTDGSPIRGSGQHRRQDADHGTIVADAAREDEEMPDRVVVAPLVLEEEIDPQGVEDPAGHQPVENLG